MEERYLLVLILPGGVQFNLSMQVGPLTCHTRTVHLLYDGTGALKVLAISPHTNPRGVNCHLAAF